MVVSAIADVLVAYEGSSADLTRALYARLDALGPAGQVATNLLRACKTSERAKGYRRSSSRGASYDTKQWAMGNLCALLAAHAAALGIAWGWGSDDQTEGFPWVLYIEPEAGQQISFHARARGDGPDYLPGWDGVRGVSGTRACAWAARLLDGQGHASAPAASAVAGESGERAGGATDEPGVPSAADLVRLPRRIRAATLFSGIGAPEVAMPGWDWLWHAEVEAFASAVIAARHPGSANLGDVTVPDFAERARKFGPIDVIVAGPPCQAWSVAGERRGFEDPRGNIIFRFLEIIDQIKPEFVVFENVPGLLSDCDGQSFETILCKFNEIGYSIEGDIIDAQHFGVPQRRRRIFLLCANVELGRNRRSPFFAAAIGQLLTDSLLGVLVAAGSLLKASDPDSASVKYGARSLQQRMKLFGLWQRTCDGTGHPTDLPSLKSLLDDWAEAVLQSPKERTNSASPSGNSKSAAGDTPGEKSSASGAARAGSTASRSMSTSPSWSDAWDAVCAAARSSTTSTSTKTITSRQIFSCAEVALTIVNFIFSSNGLPPNSFDEGSSCLMALRGFTDYARWADSDLFARLEGVHDWDGFARRAERTIVDAERHLGDRAYSGEVFPVPDGMLGDPPPSREAGQRAAGTVTARAGNGSRQAGANGNLIGVVAGTLDAASGKSRGAGTPPGLITTDVAPTLRGGSHSASSYRKQNGSDEMPLVAYGGNNTSGPIDAATAVRAKGGTGHDDFESETFVVGAMSSATTHGVIAFDETQITHPENRSRPDDRSPQLAANARPPTIAFDCKAGGNTSFAIGDQAGALRGDGFGGGHAAIAFKPSHFTRDKDSGPSDADKGDQDPVLMDGAAVRRLTPVECARLQGFPDDYLDIKFRGKPAADGPKYRALGNAMCVPEVRWILSRIETFEKLR